MPEQLFQLMQVESDGCFKQRGVLQDQSTTRGDEGVDIFLRQLCQLSLCDGKHVPLKLLLALFLHYVTSIFKSIPNFLFQLIEQIIQT